MTHEELKTEVQAAAEEKIDEHKKADRRKFLAVVWVLVTVLAICAVLSVGFLTVLDKANDNAAAARTAADHAQSAICIQIAYLEAVSRQSAALIESDPNRERNAIRIQQLGVTNVLIGLLRAEVTSCPAMDAFERALDDFQEGRRPESTPVPTPKPKP